MGSKNYMYYIYVLYVCIHIYTIYTYRVYKFLRYTIRTTNGEWKYIILFLYFIINIKPLVLSKLIHNVPIGTRVLCTFETLHVFGYTEWQENFNVWNRKCRETPEVDFEQNYQWKISEWDQQSLEERKYVCLVRRRRILL